MPERSRRLRTDLAENAPMAPVRETNERLVFVTASRQREHPIAKLETADFAIVPRAKDATIVAEARIGGAPLPRIRGSFRNVAFSVSRDGVRTAVMKGRCWTGRCGKNMLLTMSYELARRFHPEG